MYACMHALFMYTCQIEYIYIYIHVRVCWCMCEHSCAYINIQYIACSNAFTSSCCAEIKHVDGHVKLVVLQLAGPCENTSNQYQSIWFHWTGAQNPDDLMGPLSNSSFFAGGSAPPVWISLVGLDQIWLFKPLDTATLGSDHCHTGSCAFLCTFATKTDCKDRPIQTKHQGCLLSSAWLSRLNVKTASWHQPRKTIADSESDSNKHNLKQCKPGGHRCGVALKQFTALTCPDLFFSTDTL
jgi:hypothetical protein